jgi:uncharacterized protein (DUF885 family)
MTNRRKFLTSAGCAALAATLPRAAFAKPSDASAQFQTLLDSLAGSSVTPADRFKALKAFNATELTAEARLEYDSARQGAALQDELSRKFPFGQYGNPVSPYVVSQRNGAWQDVTRGAVKAPTKIAHAIDAESERIKADAALGVAPPDFIVTLTADKLGEARKSADDAGLKDVATALTRQIETLKAVAFAATADSGGGVWRFKSGVEYYSLAMQAGAAKKISAEAAHLQALEEIRRLNAQLEPLLQAQGLTSGSVGARLHTLGQDQNRLYADDEAGRAKAIADMNGGLATVRPALTRAFSWLPSAPLSIKLADIGLRGYRQTPSYDGSRPGIYFVDLSNIRKRPNWSLRTVVHHELIPGHMIEAPLHDHAHPPALRQRYCAKAFSEGWAVYAEQLCGELGIFDKDPLAEIGMLQSQLEFQARLAVDTGIHHLRWTREKAISALYNVCGDMRDPLETEVDRIFVEPGVTAGQAVGRTAILALRDKAARTLKDKFDIKAFHAEVLKRGDLPIWMLERAVSLYVAGRH